MTDFDLALFRLLQEDGRMPFTTIADTLGVSEVHVRRRMRHLIEGDVFSITAVGDPAILGVGTMAWIGIVASNAQILRVAETLTEFPEVGYVVVSSGAFNVMAEVACADQSELYDLLVRVRAIHGIQRTETFVYLRLLQQQFQWADPDAPPGARVAPILSTSSATSIDDLDRRLIGALQDNGRASFRDIAAQLGVSERTISSRYTRLIDDELIRVIAVGDPIGLGFDALAWLGITLLDGADLQETVEALSGVRELSYLVSPSGRYDLMAEAVCRDRSHLLDTLALHVGETAGVARVETFFYLRILYRSTTGAWGAARTLPLSPNPKDFTQVGIDARSKGSP